MEINTKRLQQIVRETLSEIDVNESDLIVRKADGQSWEELASDFKMDSEKMLSDIANDKYKNAINGIDELMGTLKIWKHKIMNGLKDGVKGGEEYNFSRFNFEEKKQ